MNKNSKIVPINYSSQTFSEIKEGLVQHAKRYYPDSYKDFSEAGFGSLMLDTVAYIGDSLSFYVDYNSNEAHLKTAIQYDNVLKHGYKLGYKHNPFESSYGTVALYCVIPALPTQTIDPDLRYAPIVKRGSIFTAGANAFTLIADVDMSSAKNLTKIARTNANGSPTHYAIKAYGAVSSGVYKQIEVSVGDFEKFFKVTLDESNITEIISIFDSFGNEYFEVDYLSQNIAYKALPNFGENSDTVSSVLVPVATPRRFVVERYKNNTQIVFGASSDFMVENDSMVQDPTKFALKMKSREYISDESFDPKKLITSDKFGIGPSNTVLTIVYKINTTETVNAAVKSINFIQKLDTDFKYANQLDNFAVNDVKNSFVVDNESAIVGDVSTPTVDELKRRILNNFAAQNRAVTEKDYEASVYSMPSQFGAVKRVKALKDITSFKRNLNLYVLSELDGSLVAANKMLKTNIKTWLNKNKLISDTIDIKDAKIINLSVDFEFYANNTKNKYDILSEATTVLRQKFSRKPEIGEPFYITDILNYLKNISGVADVKDVYIKAKYGPGYSNINYSIDASFGSCKGPDDMVIYIPANVIWEIKYPQYDINGVVL